MGNTKSKATVSHNSQGKNSDQCTELTRFHKNSQRVEEKKTFDLSLYPTKLTLSTNLSREEIDNMLSACFCFHPTSGMYLGIYSEYNNPIMDIVLSYVLKKESMDLVKKWDYFNGDPYRNLSIQGSIWKNMRELPFLSLFNSLSIETDINWKDIQPLLDRREIEKIFCYSNVDMKGFPEGLITLDTKSVDIHIEEKTAFLLSFLQKTSSLRTLDLKLMLKDDEKTREMILTILERNPYLHQLSISWKEMDDNFGYEMIKRCPGLTYLFLRGGVGNKTLEEVGRGCHKIRTFSCYTKNVTDEGISKLFYGRRRKSLMYFDIIGSSGITGKSVGCIIQNKTCCFKISGGTITDDNIYTLFVAGVTKFFITSSKITGKVIQMMSALNMRKFNIDITLPSKNVTDGDIELMKKISTEHFIFKNEYTGYINLTFRSRP